MPVGDNIRTFLLADASIAAAVGTRVYPIALPQKPTLPAIRYNTISSFETSSTPGVRGLIRPRIQFDSYGTTYAAARALAELLRDRLSNYRGAAGSATVQGAFFVNESEVFDPEQKAYKVMQDFFIWLPG